MSTFSHKKQKYGKWGRFHYFRKFSLSFFSFFFLKKKNNKTIALYFIKRCSSYLVTRYTLRRWGEMGDQSGIWCCTCTETVSFFQWASNVLLKNTHASQGSNIRHLNFLTCSVWDSFLFFLKRKKGKESEVAEVTLPAIPWVCSMKFFQLSPAPCAEGRSAAAAPWSCALSPSPPLHCTSSFQPNMTMSVCAAGAFCLLLSTGRAGVRRGVERAEPLALALCRANKSWHPVDHY